MPIHLIRLRQWILFAAILSLLLLPAYPAHAQDIRTTTEAALLPSGIAQTQPEPEVVAKYTGTIQETVSDKVNGQLFPDLCQQDGPAELDLFADGTLALTATLKSTHLSESESSSGSSASCAIEENTVPWKFRGTYPANLSSLTISALCMPSAEGETCGPIEDMQGSGTLSKTTAQGQIDFEFFGIFHFEFNLQAESAAVTSEYIYNTYGIRVEDSFGDNQYAAKAWSEHELTLLNDVLKELPPTFIKNLSLTKIIRNSMAFDNGTAKPYRGGTYTCCDPTVDPDCTGSSASIRIFDFALTPSPEFPNDPNGDAQFKAILLHEITHAAEYYKDKNSIYKDAYSSPLMQNFMDATRPNTALNAGIAGNGWGYYGAQGWKYFGANGNQPPTNYGKTNPKEDLSESVKLYMYDPEKLKNVSMQRYAFIRDQMFGGVEYANGQQKKQ